MKHECTIGLWSDYEYSPLVTLSDLVEMQPDSIYTMSMLTNNRYNTCLIRFTYCPECGKKIDWETIRNNYKDK
jgi:hypothetical protein